MKKQPFCNFMLAGVSLTEFGLEMPSPYSSLSLENSEITSMTAWTLNITVIGSSDKQSNIASFEALLYSAAQQTSEYSESAGIPVSFIFGWLDDNGNMDEYISYQGWTLTFEVSTSGLYMNYKLTGYASQSVQSSVPVLNIPAVSGIVQPSAVLEALCKATKADYYYNLDIDHNDAPTLIEHNALTTSFNRYVRGEYNNDDDYDSFPGLLSLSKSYQAARDSTGLKTDNVIKSLSQVMNNVTVSNVGDFLKTYNTDTTPQVSTFSYWIDEPTMSSAGCVHFKSNASLMTTYGSDILQYGTADTNILSLSGSYNGVAYDLQNMNFTQLGFAVDVSGNLVAEDTTVVNSWSASLADTYQTSNIINDINALSTQFQGNFKITIPGSVKTYNIAQPVTLVVMSGNTVSPITGIYNIMSVSHTISDTFTTTLQIQRLVSSSANEVATSQNIYVTGLGTQKSSYTTTSNIISPYKVDFGTLYPDFTYMQSTI